jgi:hypothetical protein
MTSGTRNWTIPGFAAVSVITLRGMTRLVFWGEGLIFWRNILSVSSLWKEEEVCYTRNVCSHIQYQKVSCSFLLALMFLTTPSVSRPCRVCDRIVGSMCTTQTNQTAGLLVRRRIFRLSDRHWSANSSANFLQIEGCRVISAS